VVNGLQRVRILVQGQVQGVGFRFFAQHAALSMRLTGYIKNCSDGSVALEAQGTEAAVEELVRVLEQGPRLAQVERLQVTPLAVRTGEEGFEIRFN
jgi:acylphosphatase